MTLSLFVGLIREELPLFASCFRDRIQDDASSEGERATDHQSDRKDGSGEARNQSRLEVFRNNWNACDQAQHDQDERKPTEEGHGFMILEERRDRAQHLCAVAEGGELGIAPFGSITVIDRHICDAEALVNGVNREFGLDLKAFREYGHSLHEDAIERAIAGHDIVKRIAIDHLDQPATEDEASSEQLAENAPSAEQSDPFEIVSDPELGDYEKGKVLIYVDDSQSIDQINAVLEDSEFAQTKSVSEQDTSVGFVQVEISDTTEIEQALASFERAGLEVQPNYVYYPAEETVHEEEIQERRACSDGNESRNEDLQKREDAIRETTIGEEAAAVAEEQTNVHAELSSPNEAIVSLVGTEAITKINDPQASSQWALDSLDMYKAWNIKKCEGAVSVAVIDTGCLTSHEDLRANIKDTYNSVDKTSTVTDDDPGGHGTHVAGIVSADADNGIGVAGTSYDAGLIIIKSSKLDNGSSAFSSAWLAQAYAWLMGDDDNDGSTVAQTHNVRVVNMSLGGKGAVGGDIAANDKALLDKITEAKSKQILTVCAAGNSMANATPPYDCSLETILIVSALSTCLRTVPEHRTIQLDVIR